MLYDLRLAARRLRNAPAFTLVAIVTPALAIGANTAIFSVADAVLFKQLPYADAGRVNVLATLDSKTRERSRGVPFVYLQAIDEHHRGLSEVGLRGPTMMTIHAGDNQAEWMETFAVTPGLLSRAGGPGSEGRIVRSPGCGGTWTRGRAHLESWQRRFGGDENIVGRAVKLGTQTRDVIGVLPAGFIFPTTTLRFLYNPTGRPEYLTVTMPPSREGGRRRHLVDSKKQWFGWSPE